MTEKQKAKSGPLKITQRKTDSLIPYARNARTHTPAQISQIAASIQEFGWTTPILIDGKSIIIAGHARVEAAQKLGIDKVPTIEVSHLTETQKRAYILADNKLAMNAGWDEELLSLEIQELKMEEYPLEIVGFSEVEIDGYLAQAERTTGLTDEDEEQVAGEKPISLPLEVWTLGPHRLVCGDSTEMADVSLLFNGVMPHLMVTDPPYGVEYDANWRNEADRSNGKPIGGRAVGKVKGDNQADWTEAYAHFPGNVVYTWSAPGPFQIIAFDALIKSGFQIRQQIIWAKSSFVIGRGHYHYQHEPCWYAVRKGGKGNWAGGRKQSSIWNIDKPMKSETGHSTQKPVECMRRPMENNSSPGQAVYDPFMGSGTSIIAAETTGRVCYGMEIHPPYCDMAIRRWQNFTGKEAVNQDGKTFNQCEKERSK